MLRLAAAYTMKMWINFAITCDMSVAGAVKWPVYEQIPAQGQYGEIDDKPEIKSGLMETFKPGE